MGWGGSGEVPAPMIMTLIPVFGPTLLIGCEAMVGSLVASPQGQYVLSFQALRDDGCQPLRFGVVRNDEDTAKAGIAFTQITIQYPEAWGSIKTLSSPCSPSPGSASTRHLPEDADEPRADGLSQGLHYAPFAPRKRYWARQGCAG
jgi:hypothetical protein